MERRAYPRIETSHSVLYWSNVHPRPKVASTLDLSVGGAKIVTPYSLMAGETLRLSIAVHPEVIECKGEVVHVLWPDGEKLKAGLRFEEISEGDKLYLKQYLFDVMEKQAAKTISPRRKVLSEAEYESLEAVSITSSDPHVPICRLIFPGQVHRGSFGCVGGL